MFKFSWIGVARAFFGEMFGAAVGAGLWTDAFPLESVHRITDRKTALPAVKYTESCARFFEANQLACSFSQGAER
jgi:hypothetical protein